MPKKNIFIAICIVFIFFVVSIFSNSYILSRIKAHIDDWRGVVKLAENIVVTFPEGTSNAEMATILENKIPNFDKNLFIQKINDKQGYLFPDTYFFNKNSTVDKVVIELATNFDKKISPIKNEVTDSGYTLNEILAMASIIEAEAKGSTDANIVAGILWKRIKNHIPLQVDAAPVTYKILGIPANPINNPGIASIKAVLEPTDTPYLFYLHDKEGDIHLAKNFTEHKNNIKKYLK